MKVLKFPEDFSWGSAIWAQGTEGAYDKDGKSKTVWDRYHELQPERFFEEVGPSETLNWYERYPEYIKIAKELNQKSFRTSISWARLMPDGKTINPKAVEFYTDMFKEFKKNNIDLYIVLYWFDMPLCLENKGGFGSKEVVDLFVNYSKKCFELFDGLVDIWHIYNEPRVDIDNKYIGDICYPNKVDFKFAMSALYNMIVAHAKVVKEFNNGNFKGRIGSVIDINKVYPRSNNTADIEAGEYAEFLLNRCFLDPLIKGEFEDRYFEILEECNAKPEVTSEDLKVIKENTIKVLGINYYFPSRVKAKENLPNPKAPINYQTLFDNYEMHGRRMNKYRGWEIYPKALYDMLMDIKNKYGNIECYISENGMGVQEENRFRDDEGIINDSYRIEFTREHLEWIHKAINDGVNLKGYHIWSFIDLWSPSNMFRNCYGLVEFNLKDKTTKIKRSGYWYKQVINENGFTVE